MKTYRVGIIGFGFIGKVHAYAHRNLPFFYRDLPYRTRITHVCSGHLETAEAGRALLGADVATTDFRRITENPDIDLVHICTPNHLHCEMLLSAMAHGKHIYCDKPLTAVMAEADRVAAAAATFEATFQVTFQNRFFPAVMRARQLVAEGRLGRILQFRAAFLHSGSTNPDAPLKWKLTAEAGGGVIADLGSHMLDFVHSLVGDYESVCACSKTAYPSRPSVQNPSLRVPVTAEDCSLVLARMKGGAAGTVEASKLATGTQDELRLELHGSAGALRYNSMRPFYLEYYDAGAVEHPLGGERGWTHIDAGQRYPDPGGFPGPKMSIGWLRSHVACLFNFMDAVHRGRPAEPGLEQAVYIQRLMHLVRTSARTGAWVTV